MSKKDPKEADKKKPDSKQDELFIGGIDQRGGGSGLAVIPNPPPGSGAPRPGGAGIFDRIVEQAQNRSEDSGPPPTGSGGLQRVIILYRNGFIVDDGPFRDITSPENQTFIRSLEAGNVPAEMSQGATGDIEVSLNDKRAEDYVPPPPPSYVAFSSGTTLGSSSGSSSGEKVWVASPEDGDSAIPVDESEPNSTLQVKTYDGKRLRIKMNNKATILHLAATIRSQWPTGASDSFSLNAGFPPKDLTNPNQTISEAGLVGSSVTLKKI